MFILEITTYSQEQENPLAIALMGLMIFAAMVGTFILGIRLLISILDYTTGKAIGSGRFRHLEIRRKKLLPRQILVLEQNFPYYQKLPPKSKLIFQSRVRRFYQLKSFIGKEGLTLTDEMKIFISASAIQLTFGLRDFRFLHFKTIEIYSENFFSKSGQAYHLGETDTRGILRFSWHDFVKGYAIGDDNRNLGLHEFSHALFLNYLSGKKNDLHFEKYYEVWKSEGSEQYFGLKKKDCPYIREYAQTNLMEFFAVCVECFFETPAELHRLHPKIFHSLKKLLGQNPMILNQS